MGTKSVRSSHDVLDDPRLSRQFAVEQDEEDAAAGSKRKAGAAALRASAQSALRFARDKAGPSGGSGGGGGGDGEGAEDDGAGFDARMRQQMQAKREWMAAAKAAAPASAAEAARVEFEKLRGEMAESAAKEASSKPGYKWRGKGGKDSDDDDLSDSDDEAAFKGMSVLERQRAKYLQKKRESAGLTKKQRQEATLAKLQMFKTGLGGGGGRGRSSGGGGGDDDDDVSLKCHSLRFDKKSTMAESAAHYDSFDPLKHGEDDARARAKIKERERAMLSFACRDEDD